MTNTIKTKLQQALEQDNYEFPPEYVINCFCLRKTYGFTSPCIPGGLKACIKHYNELVTEDDPGINIDSNRSSFSKDFFNYLNDSEIKYTENNNENNNDNNNNDNNNENNGGNNNAI